MVILNPLFYILLIMLVLIEVYLISTVMKDFCHADKLIAEGIKRGISESYLFLKKR